MYGLKDSCISAPLILTNYHIISQYFLARHFLESLLVAWQLLRTIRGAGDVDLFVTVGPLDIARQDRELYFKKCIPIPVPVSQLEM